jgi:hypothetical protein
VRGRRLFPRRSAGAQERTTPRRSDPALLRRCAPERRRFLLATGLLLSIAIGSSACASRAFAPPAPGGTPAPDGVAQFQQAVSGCAAIDTLTAEAGLSGRVAGARARGRLHLGLSRSGGFRIEGVAPFGAPVFVLAGRSEAATLVLPRDQRVVANVPARDLMAALAGVTLEPGELLELMTGCLGHRERIADGSSAPTAQRAGRWTWVRTPAGIETWLDAAGSAPLIVAARRGALIVDYPQRAAGPPRTIHIVQQEASGARVADLTLRLSDVELNATLANAAFDVDVPAGATPMTLDELRRSGPLGAR